MKTVDIHADDYGYSINTSKDMLECMKAGALDSISIICNTKWFEDSMEMLYREIPHLPFFRYCRSTSIFRKGQAIVLCFR